MLRKNTTVTVILFFALISLSAQTNNRLIQISGYVSSADSVNAIPFATIRLASTPFGCAADINGFFTLPAHNGDTLRVTGIGFRERKVLIPDTLHSDHYLLYVELSTDTVLLPETTVMPWPSRNQFKEAFINANVPDDDLERARKNLPEATLRAAARNMDMDGSMTYKQSIDDQIKKSYYAGQTTPLTIFDVGAWYRFIKAVRNGKLKNPDKNK